MTQDKINIWLLVPKLWSPKMVQRWSEKKHLHAALMGSARQAAYQATWSWHWPSLYKALQPWQQAAHIVPPALKCARSWVAHGGCQGGPKVSGPSWWTLARAALAGRRPFPQGAQALKLHRSQCQDPSNLHRSMKRKRSAFLSSETSPGQERSSTKGIKMKKIMTSCSLCKFFSPWNEGRCELQRLKLKNNNSKMLSSLSDLLNL